MLNSTSNIINNNYKNAVIAIFSACIGCFLYTSYHSILKTIGSQYHFSQILTIIYLVQLPISITYGYFFDREKSFKTNKAKLILSRGVIVQLIAMVNIITLPNIELTSFYTISFTSPLIVCVLAAIFLKDHLGKSRLIAVFIGLATIIYIYRPGGEIFNIWSLGALTRAILISIHLIIIRKLGTSESKNFTIMTSAALGLLFNLPIAITHYTPIPMHDLTIITTGAIILMVAYAALAYGYQTAPSAALLSPFQYTQIIWGALIGFIIYNEIPSHNMITGAIIIICTGIYLLISERKYIKS